MIKKTTERKINIVKPLLPKLSDIKKEIEEILNTGNLTNNSKYVVKFEEALKKYLGVKYCVTVANGTLGLMLALNSLDLKKGEIIVPSFTFSATVHSIIWCGLKPVFTDIDPETFNIDIKDTESKITPKTKAVLAVNTYGNPCEIESLKKLVSKYKLKLIFDSAHAFGSRYKNKKIGSFPDIEVFSFHATKILPTGEGGVVTTNNKKIYEKLILYRNFGNPGNDNCILPGLNAKMMEFSAILGLKILPKVDYYIKQRKKFAQIIKKRLGKLKGIKFQKLQKSSSFNYQYFPVLINKKEFGSDRDKVYEYLLRKNIISRKYFYPPVHKFKCYKNLKSKNLKNTEYISKRILCLPIYSETKSEEINRIVKVFENMGKSMVNG